MPSIDKPIWIVVLHYQDASATEACLQSLADYPGESTGVLLIDNGSPDFSGQALADKFTWLDFLRIPENLGFAGGANFCVEACLSRGASWIWLLNNDTQVLPETLSILLKTAESQPSAGLLGALTINTGNGKPTPAGRGEINWLAGKTMEKAQIPENVDFLPCQWLSGCNLLIRAKAFLEAGGFDPDYFLYFEDCDFCLRIQKAGWLCLLVPGAKIMHKGGASTAGHLAIWRSYYHTRNRLIFFSKHAKGMVRFTAMCAILSHIIRHSLVLPFRGKEGLRKLRAELLGLADFMAGEKGKSNRLNY